MTFLDALKKQLDPESFRKLADVRSAVEGRFMKLADGINTVRILPAYKEGGLWFREVRNHFKVGGGERNRVCVCNAAETPPSRCFVDDAITVLAMSPSKEDQEAARNMKASRVFWVNAYDVKAEEPVVKILPLSFTVFGQVFQLFISGEDFVHPETGFNVIITKNPGNRYNVRLDRQSSAIANEDLLGQCHDLDAIVQNQRRSYEEQKGYFPPELVARVESSLGGGKSFEGTGTITPEAPIKEAKDTGGDNIKSGMDKLKGAIAGEKVVLGEID